MEIRHRILAFSGSAEYGIMKAELERIGAKYEIHVLGSIGGVEHTSLEFTVAKGDPLYPQVAELIERHGFYAQTGVHYSEQEISEAEWLTAEVGEFQYPQPEDTYIEATYDISTYCPHCGIGAAQSSPFRLKSDFQQKRAKFLGLHWVFDEVFVRPEVRAILEELAIGDVRFLHPVHHRTGQPIETVYQMVIRTTARPGLVTEGLQPVACREDNEEVLQRRAGEAFGLSTDLEQYGFCGRSKYHYPQAKQLAFTRPSLSGLPDIVKSNEYFGSGAEAHRLILVNRRLADLVKRHRFRGLKLTPIRLL
jgi:hypothetical protein